MSFAQRNIRLLGSIPIESALDERLEKIRAMHSPPPVRLPFSITFQVDTFDILGWLSRQYRSPRVYWANRNGESEIGGCGAATAMTALQPNDIETRLSEIEALLVSVEDDPFPRLIGGRCFDANSPCDELWSGFPPLWFVMPEITISRDRTGHHVTITTMVTPNTERGEIIGKIDEILEGISPGPLPLDEEPLPEMRSRMDHPDLAHWTENVNHLLDEIAGRSVEKVVLARRTDLVFSGILDPFSMLARMKEKNRNCFTFLFEPRPGKAFVGASPERLFKVDGRRIVSEAISGTTGRGVNRRTGDGENDAHLYSDKNLLEHQFVLDDVSSKMEVLCEALNVPNERSTFELSNLSHIYSRITGILKDDVSLGGIMSALHPTPAVGGTPREKALPMVRKLEPFDRGWYASPVGVIGRRHTDMAVAIRSAVIHENRAHLFAGAGIVPGSSPDAEWRELEHKISHSIEGLSGVLL